MPGAEDMRCEDSVWRAGPEASVLRSACGDVRVDRKEPGIAGRSAERSWGAE
jgi:hypothetical protein